MNALSSDHRKFIIFGLVAFAWCYAFSLPNFPGVEVSSVALSWQDAAGILGGRWKEFGCGVVFGLGLFALVAMGPAGAALAISSSAIGLSASVALHGAMLCAFA